MFLANVERYRSLVSNPAMVERDKRCRILMGSDTCDSGFVIPCEDETTASDDCAFSAFCRLAS